MRRHERKDLADWRSSLVLCTLFCLANLTLYHVISAHTEFVTDDALLIVCAAAVQWFLFGSRLFGQERAVMRFSQRREARIFGVFYREGKELPGIINMLGGKRFFLRLGVAMVFAILIYSGSVLDQTVAGSIVALALAGSFVIDLLWLPLLLSSGALFIRSLISYGGMSWSVALLSCWVLVEFCCFQWLVHKVKASDRIPGQDSPRNVLSGEWMERSLVLVLLVCTLFALLPKEHFETASKQSEQRRRSRSLGKHLLEAAENLRGTQSSALSLVSVLKTWGDMEVVQGKQRTPLGEFNEAFDESGDFKILFRNQEVKDEKVRWDIAEVHDHLKLYPLRFRAESKANLGVLIESKRVKEIFTDVDQKLGALRATDAGQQWEKQQHELAGRQGGGKISHQTASSDGYRNGGKTRGRTAPTTDASTKGSKGKKRVEALVEKAENQGFHLKDWFAGLPKVKKKWIGFAALLIIAGLGIYFLFLRKDKEKPSKEHRSRVSGRQARFARKRFEKAFRNFSSVEMDSANLSVRVVKLYNELLAYLASRGCEKPLQDTPDEYLHKLVQELPAAEPAMSYVTRVYVMVFFGRKRPRAEDFQKFVAAVSRMGQLSRTLR